MSATLKPAGPLTSTPARPSHHLGGRNSDPPSKRHGTGARVQFHALATQEAPDEARLHLLARETAHPWTYPLAVRLPLRPHSCPVSAPNRLPPRFRPLRISLPTSRVPHTHHHLSARSPPPAPTSNLSSSRPFAEPASSLKVCVVASSIMRVCVRTHLRLRIKMGSGMIVRGVVMSLGNCIGGVIRTGIKIRCIQIVWMIWRKGVRVGMCDVSRILLS